MITLGSQSRRDGSSGGTDGAVEVGKLNGFGSLTGFTGERLGGIPAEAYDEASSEAIIPMTSRLKGFASGVSVCHSDD